jgi:hypothetical protein
MDIKRTIDHIEQLEEMFEAPDIRPLSASDLAALNRRPDECSRTVRGFGCGTGRAVDTTESLRLALNES